MDAQAIQAMLREDREEWEALVAVLEAHPDGPLHDPESPDWTARDVYTHLARMVESTTALMEGILAGRPSPDFEPFDEFEGDDEGAINARIQRKYSHMRLDEARERAQRAFERRIRAIESVPTDRWDAQLEEIARGDGSQHYRAHRSFIVVT